MCTHPPHRSSLRPATKSDCQPERLLLPTEGASKSEQARRAAWEPRGPPQHHGHLRFILPCHHTRLHLLLGYHHFVHLQILRSHMLQGSSRSWKPPLNIPSASCCSYSPVLEPSTGDASTTTARVHDLLPHRCNHLLPSVL